MSDQAALYMRISKDDTTGESASIATQRNLLRAFAQKQGFSVFEEYIDDGWSGTNFERPAFQKMLRDIEEGKINLVLTKDLSRLGRDYILTGQYTEHYFPKHHVRYIAINDSYDSLNQADDMIPFKNVINEMYARDLSKKIRSSLAAKMAEGDFIGNFAPYGYQKSPQKKHVLIVDKETAPVVQKIFKLAAEGYAPSSIAKVLNQEGILSPLAYRLSKSEPANTFAQHTAWCASTIRKMLCNPVYLGHMAQGKHKKISFKSTHVISCSKEDWVIVENTHPALISSTEFHAVQKKTAARTYPHTGSKNLFSGLAKCSDCRHNMSLSGKKADKSAKALVCGQYKQHGKTSCKSHFINYEDLSNIVLSEIQELTTLSSNDITQMTSHMQEAMPKQDFSLKKEVSHLEARTQQIDILIQTLYEDRVTKQISEDRFCTLYNTYEREQAKLKIKLKNLRKKLAASQSREDVDFASVFPPSILSAALLQAFVETISVGEPIKDKESSIQEITITYRFSKPVPKKNQAHG